MGELSQIQSFAVWVLPVLFAITLHEVAHGWMALRLGDPTAKMLGRLTLNPLKHIDPVGTVLVPTLLFLMGGFIFGWAKPVPITWQNLRQPRRDVALVALAGPLANLVMAIGWALLARVGVAVFDAGNESGLFLVYTGSAGIIINIVLMVLNLLPLPPLDGGRVAVSALPGRWGWQLSRVEPYGFFILLGLLATGLLGQIMGPIVNIFIDFLAGMAGLLVK